MMNTSQSTTDDPIRNLRKEFFAFRNGIIADKLRAAGDPHAMIMGCLLADIVAITSRAREAIGDDNKLAAIAQELWKDTNSRECRLAAPLLFPPELMSQELALNWCQDIETIEVADNLCHKLLRHIPESRGIMDQLIAQKDPMAKYTGYRLMQGLLVMGKLQPTPAIISTVEAEAACAQSPLSRLLDDVLESLKEE